LNACFLRLAAALAVGAAAVCHAAPLQVEAFDLQAWQALQASGGNTTTTGTAVVFTTTDCAYCPAVLQQLAKEIRQRKMNATLVAVVMDVAPGQDDALLLNDPHHRDVDRLLAFSGQAAALRHAVNPAWRGVTPYVVFLAKGAAPRWVTGPPPPQAVNEWAATAR
jgi:cytosine/adenosine deaminase-related metal-dependent hydrolase